MKKLSTLLVLLFMVACSTNPMTGRMHLSLVSNSELFIASFKQYNTMLIKSSVVKGTKDAKTVERVGRRVQQAAETYFKQKGMPDFLSEYKWEFKLIADKQQNAFCMPGGKVAFYSGIMATCATDNGVAVVMGHEVAHAIANHGGERASQQIAAQVGMAAGGIALSNSQWANTFNVLYPMGAQLATLSYSRGHESEADEMGLTLMAMAGYDPREAPVFWTRMKKTSSGNRPAEFLSTHPSPEKRISDLNKRMDKAVVLYNQYKR